MPLFSDIPEVQQYANPQNPDAQLMLGGGPQDENAMFRQDIRVGNEPMPNVMPLPPRNLVPPYVPPKKVNAEEDQRRQLMNAQFNFMINDLLSSDSGQSVMNEVLKDYEPLRNKLSAKLAAHKSVLDKFSEK